MEENTGGRGGAIKANIINLLEGEKTLSIEQLTTMMAAGDTTALDCVIGMALRAGFLMGFNASGEGFNGEYHGDLTKEALRARLTQKLLTIMNEH